MTSDWAVILRRSRIEDVKLQDQGIVPLPRRVPDVCERDTGLLTSELRIFGPKRQFDHHGSYENESGCLAAVQVASSMVEDYIYHERIPIFQVQQQPSYKSTKSFPTYHTK